MNKNMPFFNETERGLNSTYVQVYYPNLHSQDKISIYLPNYCSFEHMGAQFKLLHLTELNTNAVRQGYDLIDEHYFGIMFQCTSCHRYISIEYVVRGTDEEGFDKTSVVPYDYSFLEDDFPFKRDQALILKEIAPKFETIYRQASKAEAIGLNEIDKMGYRKAAEFLAKGVLTNVFGKPDSDVLQRNFSQNITQLKECMNEMEVSTLQLSSWIGNDGTHFIQDNPDLSIEDMKNYIYDFASAVISDSHRNDAKEYIDKYYAERKKKQKGGH